MASTRRPSRRSVLGAALAVTGIAGSGLAARLGGSNHGEASSGASDEPVPEPGVPTLYLDRYTMQTGDRGRGGQRKSGDQTILRGTLTTGAGTRVGELYASALTMPGPIEPDTPRTPRLEIQNFRLDDGTILGMGTTFAQVDIPNVYTVIGGSGRYARARGAYTFVDNPSVAGPEGRAAVEFDVVL